MSAPTHLLVVLEDRWCTYLALVHENQAIPYGRRSVRIALTEDQRQMLAPREVGTGQGGATQYESIRECWLEYTEAKP